MVGGLLFVGCSDGSTDHGLVEVTVADFEFRPVAVVSVSGDVTVEIRNVGGVEHNWTVLRSEAVVTTSSEFDPAMAVVQVEVAPGAVETQRFVAPPGSYVVICTVPGHLEAGMHGQLTIGQ